MLVSSEIPMECADSLNFFPHTSILFGIRYAPRSLRVQKEEVGIFSAKRKELEPPTSFSKNQEQQNPSNTFFKIIKMFFSFPGNRSRCLKDGLQLS